MSRAKTLLLVVSMVVVAMAAPAVLSGCATVATYRKCGLSGCPGDEDISGRVRAQFDHYTALQPPNLIRVQTLDHVVYLTGLVNTTLVRELAGSVASGVSGAPHVVNSISVDYQGK
jgi:osmotically-inducible protein OsmY